MIAMKLKTIATAVSISAFTAVLVSCNFDKTTPGYEYMPDMYRGPAYEAYQPSATFEDGLSARKPVAGTIPRGFEVYPYENTNEGYAEAQAALKVPSSFSLNSADESKREKLLAEGKELYSIFCTHCHGDKGDGQGILVQREKILGVPSYASEARPDINEGSIYHVIHYGKGIMGSHAGQMTQEERWKVTSYVLELRAALDKAAAPKAE
jgi:mono/diheme cytochrome c family protein